MRVSYTCILLGVVCLFFACSKYPGATVPTVPIIPEPTSPAYLQRILYSKDNGQTVQVDSVTGWLSYSPLNYVSSFREPYLSFTYDNFQRLSHIRLDLDVYLSSGCYYTINYDSSDMPVSGIRLYYKSNSSTRSSDGYNLIDTIRYTVSNGKVIGISFYNRIRVGTVFSPAINNFKLDTTFYAKDTIDRYTVSYFGTDFSKVHCEGPSGKIVDLEYTYGSQKSPMIDSKSKFLVAPDLLLSSGYIYPVWHASNELLSYKKTFVTENNRVELSTFSYTYSSTHYPLTASVLDSGIAVTPYVKNGKYSMKFIYK